MNLGLYHFLGAAVSCKAAYFKTAAHTEGKNPHALRSQTGKGGHLLAQGTCGAHRKARFCGEVRHDADVDSSDATS